MPLPKTKDVGKVISFLKRDKPSMPRKQRIAIALDRTGKSRKKKRIVRKKSLKQMLTER